MAAVSVGRWWDHSEGCLIGRIVLVGVVLYGGVMCSGVGRGGVGRGGTGGRWAV